MIRYTRLYDDLQEYFGYTLEEIDQKVEQREDIILAEWKAHNPQNQEGASKFYSEGEGQLWYCVAGSGNNDSTELQKGTITHRVAVENLGNYIKREKIVDYGCGMGMAGFIFHNLGYDVTFADVPGKMFNFLKYRCMKQGRWDIKFINIRAKFPLTEMYDIIMCYDVLEHVFDPVDVLNHLSQHLNEGGLMIVEVFFDDVGGTAPYHIKENVGYGDPDTWGSIMRNAKLVPVIYNEQGHPKVYRKVK